MNRISITIRRRLCNWLGAIFVLLAPAWDTLNAQFVPDPGAQVPEPIREFRGAWVATVYNIDWPSRPGLSSAQQQSELVTLFDKAAALRMNAIVLQVRPMCDAFYESEIEPWSFYLTGAMGKAPSPKYDPLEFAVTEAHRRGLELHAWFNPFRARAGSSGSISSNHVSRTHAWVTRKAGSSTWLDPSSPFVQDRAQTVMLDVIKRYDVDAVHIDDYFYPYPNAGGGEKFHDQPNWDSYKKKGGTMTRAEWRRDNVNRFVQDSYKAIKATKPWVKFGVSPFGIYRPGYPPSVGAGLDSYEHIYTDSRLWLREGWVDYFSPQLYWQIDGAHSFKTLYHWWQSENVKGRHIWPGIAASRIGKGEEGDGRNAAEIVNQVGVTRANRGRAPGVGHVMWSFNALGSNRGSVASMLQSKAYTEIALPPASPWLAGKIALRQPDLVSIETIEGGKKFSIKFTTNGEAHDVRWWLFQTRLGDKWTTRANVPAELREVRVETKIDAFSVRPVNRAGILGPALVMKKG